MPKIFTRKPGDIVEVGHYGPASNDRGAVVPQAVAVELAGRADLRIEPDEAPAAAAAPTATKAPRKTAEPQPALKGQE